MIFFIVLALNSISACPVEDSVLTLLFGDDISDLSYQPDVSVDNPLLTNRSDVVVYYNYYRNWYDNYIYEIVANDWLGNGAMSVTDKTLCGFTLREGRQKTYENYYTGIITKKSIEYDGGYSEDLTLISYPQKYYQQEMIAGGDYIEITSPIENGTYLYENIALTADDGFKFRMKNNINL